MFYPILNFIMETFTKITNMIYQIQITEYFSLGDLILGNFVVIFSIFLIWKVLNIYSDGYDVNAKSSLNKDKPMFIEMRDTKMITGNKTYRNY